MREPSIHIREKDLAKILVEVFDLSGTSAKHYSKEISRKAKNHALVNRTLVTLKKEAKRKQAGKIVSATAKDAKMMSKMINAHRVKLKHRGIRPLKESSREWSVLKELTGLVVQFASDFELQKIVGMDEFIRISLRHLSKGSKSNLIGKMINSFDKVCDIYEGKLQMKDDTDPGLTNRLYDKYKALIVQHTGIRNVDFEKEDVLFYFFEMKRLATGLGVSPFSYLDAQFDQLQWTGTYPSPEQLINEKSKERVYKYKYEADQDSTTFKGPDSDIVEKLKSIRK